MQCIEVWLPCSYLDAAHRGRRGLNIFHIYYEDALRAVMDVKYYLAGKFKVRPIAGHKLNWNHATSMSDIIKKPLKP